MTSVSPKEKITPQRISELCFAFAPTRVLVTAVDLEVFTQIHRGAHSLHEIAEGSEASRRGMEMLLNSLTSLEFLTKQDHKYYLTPLSENFLVKGEPSYFGDFVQHVDSLWEPWSRLTEVVRTGRSHKQVDQEEEAGFKSISLLHIPAPSPLIVATK